MDFRVSNKLGLSVNAGYPFQTKIIMITHSNCMCPFKAAASEVYGDVRAAIKIDYLHWFGKGR